MIALLVACVGAHMGTDTAGTEPGPPAELQCGQDAPVAVAELVDWTDNVALYYIPIAPDLWWTCPRDAFDIWVSATCRSGRFTVTCWRSS